MGLAKVQPHIIINKYNLDTLCTDPGLIGPVVAHYNPCSNTLPNLSGPRFVAHCNCMLCNLGLSSQFNIPL
jgi:hypothetical protein